MTCPCKNKSDVKQSTTRANSITNPYTPCIFCTTKHLSYAQALYEDNDDRYLANIYLAYLHTHKTWNGITDDIVNIIKKAFKHEDLSELLDNVVHKAHTMANTENLAEDKSVRTADLNMTPNQAAYIYILSAYEMFDFELGYKGINTPYVFGLLQKACMFLPAPHNYKCRQIWKVIEQGKEYASLFKDILGYLKTKLE